MEVEASPHSPSPENSSPSIRFKGRHSQNVCRQKFSKMCLLSLGVWGDPRLSPLLHPLRGDRWRIEESRSPEGRAEAASGARGAEGCRDGAAVPPQRQGDRVWRGDVGTKADAG